MILVELFAALALISYGVTLITVLLDSGDRVLMKAAAFIFFFGFICAIITCVMVVCNCQTSLYFE